MVKYVATTHPLGQKRCRRGDACRIISCFIQCQMNSTNRLVGGLLISAYLNCYCWNGENTDKWKDYWIILQ